LCCDALAGRVMEIKKTKGRRKWWWKRKKKQQPRNVADTKQSAVKRRISMEGDDFATFCAEA